MHEFTHFFHKLWSDVSPALVVIWSCICWIMFPNDSYFPAAIAVAIGIVVDLITKLYALAIHNGGYWTATKKRIITSTVLWKKTQVKLISYLAIMIMTGLSLRITSIELLGKGISTVVYSIIFIREFQSVVENAIEAGADWLQPLLFWLKKKESNITEQLNEGGDNIEQN
ncbi:MAG: hypothetical protein ACOZCL_08415 [Bacillota bacterium]